MKTDEEVVVIKMGTNVLVSETGGIRLKVLQSLADQIALLFERGMRPILVTSGSVACGNGRVHGTGTVGQQVAAMIGQPELMLHWRDAFRQHGLIIGQVIGTHEDFLRGVTINALREAIKCRIIPVINENDPVCDEELVALKKHGDNDALAAIVATGIYAQRLIILSDVDGLFPENPKTTPGQKRVALVECITDEIRAMVKRIDSDRPTGMGSKIEALGTAMSARIVGHLANGYTSNILLDIMAGADVGTIFRQSN